MQIVEGHPDDAADICQLILDVARVDVFPTLTRRGRTNFSETLDRQVRDVLEKDSTRYLLARSDVLLGVCGFSLEGHVHHLFVDASKQGYGVGTRLLVAAMSRIEGPLSVNASLNALAFYEQQGFEYVGTPRLIDGISFQQMARAPYP